jgi:hypothetical protein
MNIVVVFAGFCGVFYMCLYCFLSAVAAHQISPQTTSTTPSNTEPRR